MKSFLVLLFSWSVALTFSQETAKVEEYSFTLTTDNAMPTGVVLSYSFPDLPLMLEDSVSEWQVFINEKGKSIPMVTQIDNRNNTVVYWQMSTPSFAKQERKFQLKRVAHLSADSMANYVDNGKDITFVSATGQSIFTYRYVDIPVPEGVSQVFSRSGFVHPLTTPKGNVVTRIQPDDHYHHLGLWNPWTHTEYKGEEIDFWNLGRELATIRHAEILNVSTGPLFQELQVVLHHIVHPGRGEELVMKEVQTYRLWNANSNSSYWYLDFESQYNINGNEPLTIKEYRYQGFSFRGPPHWEDENVKVLTSAGKDKSNGNATRAKWIQIAGPGSKQDVSSIVLMTYPSNFNYPELLRIWPTGTNKGKGNVFANFNPAQDRDWVLNPGKTYRLQYRVLLSDAVFEANELQQMHQLYLNQGYHIR